MKKVSYSISYLLFDNPEDLPSEYGNLLHEARSAIENSYTPYSNFKVGAAVLMSGGKIVQGSNYENASYPLCICAEQAAIAMSANLFPGQSLKMMAITVKNAQKTVSEPAPPCGACRQILCETELRQNDPIQIILQGETGPIMVFSSAADLLPMAFNGNFLLKK